MSVLFSTSSQIRIKGCDTSKIAQQNQGHCWNVGLSPCRQAPRSTVSRHDHSPEEEGGAVVESRDIVITAAIVPNALGRADRAFFTAAITAGNSSCWKVATGDGVYQPLGRPSAELENGGFLGTSPAEGGGGGSVVRTCVLCHTVCYYLLSALFRAGLGAKHEP